MALISLTCTPVTSTIINQWTLVGAATVAEALNSFDPAKVLLCVLNRGTYTVTVLFTTPLPQSTSSVTLNFWGSSSTSGILGTFIYSVSKQNGDQYTVEEIIAGSDGTPYTKVIDFATASKTQGQPPNRISLTYHIHNNVGGATADLYGLTLVANSLLSVTGTTTYTYGLSPPNANREDLGTQHEDFVATRLARDSRRRGPDMRPKRSFPQ
jgi:hypothetical protein